MTSATPDHRAQTLVRLALERFGSLSQAEVKTLRAAARGKMAVCGSSGDFSHPSNSPEWAEPPNPKTQAEAPPPPKGVEPWGPEREIRAELIRWLCIERQATGEVDPQGIWVLGARIKGKLDLSFAQIAFPLSLQRCRLTDNAELYSTSIPTIDLQGSWVRSINAHGANCQGFVLLRNGFRAEGEVRLLGAQIGGSLYCDRGTFKNASGPALNADGANVKGEVFLSSKFRAEGEVRLLSAEIGGDLVCEGGTFKNPSGPALSADRANVKGGVFLRNGFRAEGDVRLLGAQIGGQLDCGGGTFTALMAERAVVTGALWWTKIGNAKKANLDLIDASAGSLSDDAASWPDPKAGGSLWLDGFVYGRISAGPKSAKERLEWLGRQKAFAPQPYRQLAKVLREQEGDEDGAVFVLHEMERLRRRKEDDSTLQRLGSWISEESIGYGYYPGRALWEILGLSAVGWIVYRRAYLAGTMVPKDKDAYESFKRDGIPPDHYNAFAPLVYSVESSLPLVKLGQDDNWHPNPGTGDGLAGKKRPQTHLAEPCIWTLLKWLLNFVPGRGIDWLLARFPKLGRVPPLLRGGLAFFGLLPHADPEAPPSRLSQWLTSGRVIRLFLWIQILLGWLLATLFLAGVTGIVRKD